jgi:aryl-alcohol dehydrogenase-like predicted oxidoreductase
MVSQPDERRPLGESGLSVSPVALGCWPIAGVTSIDVNEADSVATIRAALEVGVNFFDTAHVYGYDGESERLLGRLLQGMPDAIVATKGGIHWEGEAQVRDASPARLRQECEESLRRLRRDRVDVLYLHAPDAKTPITESAGELKRLLDEGKTRAVGASNVTVAECTAFRRECPLTVVQPPYNMLQRDAERDLVPWCRTHGAAVAAYWPLMKGLLAGRLPRDHEFDPRDGRRKYPIYQGEEWRRNQDFVDAVRRVADAAGKTVAQTVLNWTMHRPGIATVLAGAKRAAQIRENAGAMGWRLTNEQLAELDAAVAARGAVDNTPAVRPAAPATVEGGKPT